MIDKNQDGAQLRALSLGLCRVLSWDNITRVSELVFRIWGFGLVRGS